ncbi:MAG: 2-amino-4-hydroxy-6-hydroxymethyldihydropteridine diphosphokinase [Rhodocyclaceae bacterium]
MNPVAPHHPVRAYIAFGANLGDPRAGFAFARERIGRLPHTRVAAWSSLYRSAPIGVGDEHPDYLNAVIALDTTMPPLPLLHALLAIEAEGGRSRSYHLAPRPLDLDLLLYGNSTISEPELYVPHPRMHQRAFVLLPLAEIAPDVRIPGQPPLAALIHAVADQAIERLGD